MSSLCDISAPLVILFSAVLMQVHTSFAAPIQFGGEKSELIISEVSERTARVELRRLDKDGNPPAEPLSTVLVPFPIIEKFRARELAAVSRIRVGKIRLVIKPHPLTILVERPDGIPVQELLFEEGTNSSIKFRTDAPVLGLGEGAKQFDRRGAFYSMLNGQRAPFLATHGGTIPVPFLIGTDGWALFIQRPWGEFDLRDGGQFRPQTNLSEPLDIFIILLDEPANVLTEYLRLTGNPVMPPKWVMGYLQSHRTLAGPDEPLLIAKTFREKKLPCDGLIYLGTGYCTNGWNVMNGTLDFNTNAFPRPSEQIRELQAEHFKVILHVNQAPRNLFGTTIDSPVSVTNDDLFSRGPYLTATRLRSIHVPTPGAPEDFESPLHIRNYWAWHRPVLALGIDGWWPDDGDELPLEARLARHCCYYEGSLQERPNQRPWSLHRNGCAGVQRYGGWLWSGDVDSTWATLAAHVPVGLNHSLSLTPFWGTDTGGFIPTSELTGELYVRWFQFSAFTPLFRSHGRSWKLRLPWGWNTGETGPVEARVVPHASELHNAQVEPICRKFLELRYRLLPYNYTLVREACTTGMPLMRALWLHYPKDAKATELGDEYLWGREILVAPVVEKGAISRRLYLPAGEWYDWWTDEKVHGQRWIERPVDLGTMPLYVRAGAILPLDPVRQFTSENVNEPMSLRIYPGNDGDFTLYEDDGASLDYQRSIASWIRFFWNDRKQRLTIEPDPRSTMKPTNRKIDIFIVPTGARRSVLYNGKPVRITF